MQAVTALEEQFQRMSVSAPLRAFPYTYMFAGPNVEFSFAQRNEELRRERVRLEEERLEQERRQQKEKENEVETEQKRANDLAERMLNLLEQERMRELERIKKQEQERTHAQKLADLDGK